MTFKRTNHGGIEWNIECDKLGLVTIDDPISVDLTAAMRLSNIRLRDGVLSRRPGSRFASDYVFPGRCAGIHQAYPSTGDAADRLYAACKSTMIRFSGTVPTLTANAMTFPSGMTWSAATKRVCFVDWDDKVFAFNGIDCGMTLRSDSLNDMHTFMLAKPAAPVASSAGTGSVTGKYRYKTREVREVNAELREYYGAMSAASNQIDVTAENINLAYAVPTDPQTNAVNVYRTSDDGGAYFFHDRITAPFTGTYVDSVAATDQTHMDPNVIDRIVGPKWACKHDGVLIILGTAAEDDRLFWSVAEHPQEFDPSNAGFFKDGHGRTMGCNTVNNSVVTFKESGVAYYRRNSAQGYDQGAFYGAFGTCSPGSIKEVAISRGSYLTFWDPREGLCVCDGINPPQSLKKTKRGSDILNIIKKEIRKSSIEDISICVHDNYIVVSYNAADADDSYNNNAVLYDIEKDVFVGPDYGYSAGPMISRDINYGASGEGELFTLTDSAAPRLVQLFYQSVDTDAIVAAPGTQFIEYWWLMGKIGAKSINEIFEYTQLSMVAKLQDRITVTCDTYNGNTQSGVIDGISTNIAIFDESLFDDGSVFGDFSFYSYSLTFGEENQGFWTQLQVKDATNNYLGIAAVTLYGIARGYQ